MRRIDHIVVAVHNLEEAGAFYGRLGFQVGARNQHPWGTENRIIQFGSSFIELITVGANAKLIPPHGVPHFSFGAFVRDYLRDREGLAMLVLSSNDAHRDAQLFAASGIGDYDVFSFERTGARPDGTTTRVAFSLAFARDSQAPGAGFFVCQQHLPVNFWDSRFQRHPNRASNITAVELTTPAPAQHVPFFTAFTDAERQSHPSGGYSFPIDGGRIDILHDAGWPLPSPQLTSFTVKVDDIENLASLLTAENIPFTTIGNTLVIPDHRAFGTGIRFNL